MKLIRIFVALLAASKSNKRPKQVSNKQIHNLSVHQQRMQWADDNDAIILIDMENVRGKSNFELTHRELLKRTSLWASVNNLENRVSFIVDHGSVQKGYYLPEVGLSIVFAGPKMKADDVLARDIASLEKNVIVITADNDLMSRCRNGIDKSDADINIQFVQPIKFISDLEILMNQLEKKKEDILNITAALNALENNDEETDTSNNTIVALTEDLAQKIDEEIKIRGAMFETEVKMREKKNMNTPKKRRQLEKRARQLCERLAMKGGQNIDHLTTLNGITNYDRKFQDAVLDEWTKLRATATRREMTGDRMLLAEHFRRTVESNVGEYNVEVDDSNYSLRYVQLVNSLVGTNAAASLSGSSLLTSDDSTYQSKGPVRLVVISDTHGFEEQLTKDGGTLPQGDVLLHLGDFAIDSSMAKKNKAIKKFDEWLARQPFRTKIILRGNHDPFSVDFPVSGANYFSRPKSISLDGKLVVTLVPYCSPRNLASSWRNMPMFCDVLASHSPPNKILDKCYNGANAGCASLRSKVERMIAGPPYLWLCGHIHEGRGSENVAFGLSPRETFVINAANANTGMASFIKYGPVVVDIESDGKVTMIEGEMIMPNSTTLDELPTPEDYAEVAMVQ
jgi:Icc-related predicted phosphoesterase